MTRQHGQTRDMSPLPCLYLVLVLLARFYDICLLYPDAIKVNVETISKHIMPVKNVDSMFSGVTLGTVTRERRKKEMSLLKFL